MPVWALLLTALKNPAEVSVVRMWELPSSFSLETFRIVWPELKDGFVNSLLLAIPASLISSMLGAMNGFVLSKWRFPGADVVFPLILFGMFIPYQAILIPMYQVMKTTGLVGGLDGLILVHVIYGLPITTLIFRSYFASISDELIEASKVDGAGMFRTFFFVALPDCPTRVRGLDDLAVHVELERLPVRGAADQSGVLADHGGPQQHRRRADDPVQPVDGERVAREHPHTADLHPAWPLLHAWPHGRRTQGVGRMTQVSQHSVMESAAQRTASGIRLDHVSKRFRGGVLAVNDVDLTVEPGEFMVLVGPSGCGKSTLLRMIAGLEDVSSGRVHIGDRDVTDDLPQKRDVAMVFQSYALYPRMTVRKNMAFGLRMRGTDRDERDRRVSPTWRTSSDWGR